MFRRHPRSALQRQLRNAREARCDVASNQDERPTHPQINRKRCGVRGYRRNRHSALTIAGSLIDNKQQRKHICQQSSRYEVRRNPAPRRDIRLRLQDGQSTHPQAQSEATRNGGRSLEEAHRTSNHKTTNRVTSTDNKQQREHMR